MELIKPQELKKPEAVKSWRQIKGIARELVTFIDQNNEAHVKTKAGRSAYALHHAQVSTQPLNFFVVSNNVSDKEKGALLLFKSRVIVNPRIVKKEEKITRKFPNKKQVKDGDTIKIVMMMEKKEISNVISCNEGCMSFPHKKSKNVDRYYEIHVKYQEPWPRKFPFMLITKKERIDGLKAHIFQHETDHANGKNIYYGES